MKNFSKYNLISMPFIVNNRVLPSEEAESIIALLSYLDLFANETYTLYSHEQIESSFTYAMRYEMRKKWIENKDLIDEFIEKYPDKLGDEVKELLKSWKFAIKDRFICVKYFSDYAVFLSVKDNKWYAVRGLSDDFDRVIHQNPPYCLETILLPYFDSIIWDGLVILIDVKLDKLISKQMIENCKQVRRNGLLIEQLREPMSIL